MKLYKKFGFVFTPSTTGTKKYDVYKNGKLIARFGDRLYAHYKDKIGHYKHLDHLDRKRRALFYARHGKGEKYSPLWFSSRFLW